MITNKFKKVLLILGFGIGLSSLANAYPNEAVCEILFEQCEAGSPSACSSFGKWCRWPDLP